MGEYKRLNFEQYFIDTSGDYNNTGKARFKIHYKTIEYDHKNKKRYANYEIHYEAERDVIQINFEQTADNTDWFVNFNFAEDYYDQFEYNHQIIQLKAHRGWAEMYRAMKHFIRSDFLELYNQHKTAEVEIVGWSLGSAQAQLCAQDLFFNYNIKSYVYTYGSVKPFYVKNKVVKNYLSLCYKEAYNFSDVNDIVAYLPPFIRFFKFNNVTVYLEKFCFFKLFNPMKYHTHYDEAYIYRDIEQSLKS